MTSITKKVPTEEVPKAWLEGVDGADTADVIQITLDIPEPSDRSRIKNLIDSIVPEYTPHSTRATCATIAIQNGARLEDVQKMLGHAYLSTTQSYVHKVEDLRDSAVMCLKF